MKLDTRIGGIIVEGNEGTLPERENTMSDATNTEKKPDARKQSLYFPETMTAEMKAQAARLDRSLSWIVQRAWKLAQAEIAAMPSVSDEDA